MSQWQTVLVYKLMNRQTKSEETGIERKWVNVLEKAALLGVNGAPWAAQNLAVGADEAKVFTEAFQKSGKVDGGYKIGGESFHLISYDPEKQTIYLKKQGGGAVIAKSAQCFVIGVYNVALKVTKVTVKDGETTQKDFPQSQGDCATCCEDLQAYLKQNNL